MIKPLFMPRARGVGALFHKAANLSKSLIHGPGPFIASSGGYTPSPEPTKIFHAATPDLDDHSALVQRLGGGAPSTVHGAVLHALDRDGVIQEYSINDPVWKGGRVVLSGGAGSPVSEVYTDDGSGTPLDPQPMLQAVGLGLNITGTQFGVLNTPFSATGNHSIAVTAAVTGGATQDLLSSSTDSARFYIHGSNVRLTLTPDNVTFKAVDLPVGFNDGKPHEFKCAQNGTGVDYFMDDVLLGNQPGFSIEGVNWNQIAVTWNQTGKLVGSLYGAKLVGASPQTYNFDSGNVISDASEESDAVFITWSALDESSVPKSVNTWDAVNWSNTLGPFELSFNWDGEDEVLLSVGVNDVLTIASGQLTLTDGTNTVSLPIAKGEHRAAILMEYGEPTGKMGLYLDGDYTPIAGIPLTTDDGQILTTDTGEVLTT